MAEERDDSVETTPADEKKKSKLSTKLIIIIVGVLLVLGGGGFLAYTKLMGKKKEGAGQEAGGGHEEKAKHEEGPPTLVPLDPFVVNLVDAGRYMKVTVQLEIASKKDEPFIKDRLPMLRDAVVFLLSGKSLEAVSGSEGKMQLKDEMLFKFNQTIGGEIIKNVYFTDFVVQ
ncbi:MAG: flagellar basal body-associated FliL family protein [Candidatus Magnetobacterium sp. LHC-1]|uniref:Flagellar protein FliL n=2 Tax=Candidatus Magnetobacterium casense TaxID=1455061 RepID=A0ABS6RX04_9BACT|nr:flagellar basal body-associated FliL family protein [Nitrospirota bacterium]MBV6341151.1 flagellar basal body-associated FliL family protein [Candidatus Magnetobacterium casensis]